MDNITTIWIFATLFNLFAIYDVHMAYLDNKLEVPGFPDPNPNYFYATYCLMLLAGPICAVPLFVFKVCKFFTNNYGT